MTEQEWLEGDELWRMLHHALDSRAFPSRKQLLFSTAACRLRGRAIPSDYHPILAALESLANSSDDLPNLRRGETLGAWLRKGHASQRWTRLRECLDDLQRRASEVLQRRYQVILTPEERHHWEGDPRFEADDAVMYAVMGLPFACAYGDGRGSIARSRPEADLLRDLLGNLLDKQVFDPTWRTASVGSLAQTIDENDDFELLPILGDALEDEGADAALLDHLRSPGPHVRGCWALDLILGKA